MPVSRMIEKKRIGQGRTADVFAWGEGRILKLGHPRMPEFVARSEYDITRAVRAAGVPVPEAFEVVEMDGRFGVVFERVDGPDFTAELQSRPWRLIAVARRLAELHARVHAVSGLAGLPSQKRQLEHGIRAAKVLAPEEMARILMLLSRLPEGQTLCHMDFHPLNVLASGAGPVIIDWMTGTRGDPACDVARTSLIFKTVSLPPGVPFLGRPFFRALMPILHEAYLRRYRELRPLSESRCAMWEIPLLASRLREVETYPVEERKVLARLRAILH